MIVYNVNLRNCVEPNMPCSTIHEKIRITSLKMCMCSSISLLFCFIALSTGEPNIVLFQNADGFKAAVSSPVKARSGTNFSLICKTIDTESKTFLDDRIIWSKKRKKLKFSNIDDKNELMEYNIIPDADLLNFTPITLKDQGTYFCRSMKYKEFQVVHIVVDYGIKKEDSVLNQSTNRHKRDDDFKWYNDQHKANIDAQQSDVLLKFFYMLFAAVGIFVLLYAMTKCCHENNEDQTDARSQSAQRNRQRSHYYQRDVNHLVNRQRANHYQRNINGQRSSVSASDRCLHLACVRCRQEYPSIGCLFERDYPIIPDIGNSETTDIHLPLTAVIHNSNEEDLETTRLDLPPTYADSTANSAASSMHNLHETDNGFSTRILNSNNNDDCALPPSYEQALYNIVITEPVVHDTNYTSTHTDTGGSTYNSGGDCDTGGTYDSGGGGNSGDTGGGGDSGDTGGSGGGDD